MTLAARLYRFRSTFRLQAAAILGEMAIGSHTGEWSRALGECGDDTRELIEAIERVAERENMDLSHTLSDVGHLTDKTCPIWSQRLQFITDHPLGPRSEHAIGPRYDVPTEFLREQSPTAVLLYVDKLVAIGCDVSQLVLTRAAAFAAAANVIDTLSISEKQHVFERVRPLVEQPIETSGMDQFDARTQHPLSRFQMSFGRATNVRTSAGWLLAGAATSPDECSAVEELALGWVRSGDSNLQGVGAAILALPNSSSGTVRRSELANHSNSSVRKAAVGMASMRESSDEMILEQLAGDPERNVRMAVVRALSDFTSMDTDSYERTRARLNSDTSAIVRACASAL